VVQIVVTLVVAPLFGSGRRLTWPTDHAVNEDPAVAAATFAREFEEAYGAQHPRFLQCSYLDALQRAQRESKFLLLYLHAAQHQARSSAACAPYQRCAESLQPSLSERRRSARKRCALRPSSSSLTLTCCAGVAMSAIAKRSRRVACDAVRFLGQLLTPTPCSARS